LRQRKTTTAPRRLRVHDKAHHAIRKSPDSHPYLVIEQHDGPMRIEASK
jgi:hypothetical protein